MRGIEKKVAIVTGAAKGIGFATAEKLAADGAHTILTDISNDVFISLENLKKSFPKNNASAYLMDVTKKDQIDQVVEEVAQKYARIDILINNAGILLQSLILDITEEQWDKIISTNVKSVLLCSQAVLPHMIKQKDGRIVNLASQAGKRAEHGIFAYCTSKAAVIRLTQCIALEMVEYQIRCNCVCPGPTLGTEMMKKVFTEMASEEGVTFEEMLQMGAAELPMKRMANTQDIANVIAFLASDESAYMTGQAINVTGGAVWY